MGCGASSNNKTAAAEKSGGDGGGGGTDGGNGLTGASAQGATTATASVAGPSHGVHPGAAAAAAGSPRRLPPLREGQQQKPQGVVPVLDPLGPVDGTRSAGLSGVPRPGGSSNNNSGGGTGSDARGNSVAGAGRTGSRRQRAQSMDVGGPSTRTKTVVDPEGRLISDAIAGGASGSNPTGGGGGGGGGGGVGDGRIASVGGLRRPLLATPLKARNATPPRLLQTEGPPLEESHNHLIPFDVKNDARAFSTEPHSPRETYIDGPPVLKRGTLGFIFGEYLERRPSQPESRYVTVDMSGVLTCYVDQDHFDQGDWLAKWSVVDSGVWPGGLHFDNVTAQSGALSYCMMTVIDPDSPVLEGAWQCPQHIGGDGSDGQLLVFVGESLKTVSQWVSACRHVGALPSLFGAVRLHHYAYSIEDEVSKCRMDALSNRVPSQDVNRSDNIERNTVFHFAAQKDHNVFALRALLRLSTADLNRRNAAGDTCLHIAAATSHGVGEFLDWEGIDVDAVDNQGRTALHIALATCVGNQSTRREGSRRYENVVDLLKAGAKIEATNADMQTGLHILAEGPINGLCVQALHAALTHNLGDSVRDSRTRLALNGIDIDAVDKWSRSPLFVAVQSYCSLNMGVAAATGQAKQTEAFIRALIKAGANVDKWCRPSGQLPLSRFAEKQLLLTPLLYACGFCDNGLTGAIQALVEANANINVATERGDSPLHLVIYCANDAVDDDYPLFTSLVEFVNLLLNAACVDPLAKNHLGLTALETAAIHVHAKLDPTLTETYLEEHSRKAHDILEARYVQQINAMDFEVSYYGEDDGNSGFNWKPLLSQHTRPLVTTYKLLFNAVEQQSLRSILNVVPRSQHDELSNLYADDRTRESLFFPIFEEILEYPLHCLEWGKEEMDDYKHMNGAKAKLYLRTFKYFNKQRDIVVDFVQEDHLWKVVSTTFKKMKGEAKGRPEYFYIDCRPESMPRNSLKGPYTLQRLYSILEEYPSLRHTRIIRFGEEEFSDFDSLEEEIAAAAAGWDKVLSER